MTYTTKSYSSTGFTLAAAGDTSDSQRRGLRFQRYRKCRFFGFLWHGQQFRHNFR